MPLTFDLPNAFSILQIFAQTKYYQNALLYYYHGTSLDCTGLYTWNWKTNHSLSLLTFCKKRFDFEPAISFHFSSHPPFFSLFQVLQHGQPQTSSLKSEERRSVSWGAARKPASKRIGPENREERTPGRVDKSEWQVQIGRFLILSAFDRAVIHFLVFIYANMISA